MFCRLAGHRKLPWRPRGGVGGLTEAGASERAHAGLVLKYLFIYSAESCFPSPLCLGVDWTGGGWPEGCVHRGPGHCRDPWASGERALGGRLLEACPPVPLGVKGSGWAGHAFRSPGEAPTLGLGE